MKNLSLPASVFVLLLAPLSGVGFAAAQTAAPVTPASPSAASPSAVLSERPWEIGAVLQGGFGTGSQTSYGFFSAGVHGGKVLTHPLLPGLLRGQFEYAVEVFPLWQSYTPAPHLQQVYGAAPGDLAPFGGGTFTGVSVTPIILRWNFETKSRFVPWAQGAGGVVWTDHKYPPDYLVPQGTPGGTSVFNFTPQFGVGFNYFVKPKRSISFAANAVHISSASLGDHNPGVNATVQFELGYNWWK
jgi:lipid A 3-O-deacylase